MGPVVVCGSLCFALGLVSFFPSCFLPLRYLIQGRHYFNLGGKVHLGLARGALAMATVKKNEGEDLKQMIPMKKVLGVHSTISL